MSKLTIIMLSLLGFILFVYVGACIFLYTQQEKFFFHPTKLPADYQHAFAHPFEEVNLPAEGAVINAVHFKVKNPKGVILYLHGNGDVIPVLGNIVDYFVPLGYDLLIPDYRSYGKSTGEITNEAALHADMEIVYGYLMQRYAEEEIVIYAQSIGTGLSVPLAANHSPRQLILESPYFSMVSLVRSHLPIVPSFILNYPLRSDQRIGQVDCPVYIIHGDQDGLIPIEQGEMLYEQVQGKKEFLRLPGAGHGPLIRDEQLREFLGRIL